MPIWLRNFTFNKMREFFEKEAAEMKKAQSNQSGTSTVIGSDGKIQQPEFLSKASKSKPTYSTKRAKS